MELAAIVVALIVGLPGFANLYLWHLSNQSQKKDQERLYAWQQQIEAQQEHRLLLLNQPDLEPVGASLHTEEQPVMLLAGEDQRLEIHHAGGTIPTDTYGVLFPTAKYIERETMLKFPVPGLVGTYWYGKLDGAPGPGNHIAMTLRAAKNPLRGDMSIIDGMSLCASPEPDLGDILAGDANLLRCSAQTHLSGSL
jgi:hypothetical protein